MSAPMTGQAAPVTPEAQSYLDMGLASSTQEDGNGNLSQEGQSYADELGVNSDPATMQAASQAHDVEQTVNGSPGTDSSLETSLDDDTAGSDPAGGTDMPLLEPTADEPAGQDMDTQPPVDAAELNQDI